VSLRSLAAALGRREDRPYRGGSRSLGPGDRRSISATEAADRIREKVRFYDWNRATGEVRWMTAFDTTEADVDAFVAVIRDELAR